MKKRNYSVLFVCICMFIAGSGHGGRITKRRSEQIEDNGLGVQSYIHFAGRVPNANDYAIMDSIASTGVNWVRYWLCWYQVEVDSGEYTFTAADSVIEGYTSRGVNVYLTLFSGNQWYDGPDSTVYDSVAHPEQGLSPTPGSASMQGWLAFVDTAVTRYGDVVKYWDIWNEPNIDFWQPAPNAQDYAYLLVQTSQRIKSIDPSAQIIGLGTSTIDFGYISDVLQENVIDHIDYLGFHPYRIFPEDDQDNMGPWYPPTPYTDYEEELRGLLDTLAAYDTSGGVQLWDEEAGYPSQPEIFIWTPDTVYTSEMTQAKYLLRRYLLNLGFNVRVTTWFGDWDQVSSYPSILGPTWYQHYYNMNLSEKEVSFAFSFFGLTYAPPADTMTIEAEAYDSLHAPLKDGGTYLYTNDGDGDLQGSAVYFFSIADSGLYTVWLSMCNPDESACFIAYVDDSTPHWASNALATGTGSDYIWSMPMDMELIRWHYLHRGPYFFDLNAGTHRLQIQTGLDGGSLDKIVIKREDPALTTKPAVSSIQNLAALFTSQVVSDTILDMNFDNVDVPFNDWDEFRAFSFRDTSSSTSLIPYWLGLKMINDAYPVYSVNVTVFVDTTYNPRIVNLLDGSILPLTEYTTTDSSVTFDSLPVSDYPYCLVFDHVTGIAETEYGTSSKIELTVSPNPFTEMTTIVFNNTFKAQDAELKIYNISGRLVRSFSVPTAYSLLPIAVHWRADDDAGKKLPSGIYFLQYITEAGRQTRKILLIR